MNLQGVVIFTVILLLISVVNTRGQNSDNKMVELTPISSVGENICQSYSGKNLLFHVGAIGLTYLLLENNVDGWVLEQTSKMDNETTEILGFPGIIIGYITPVILPTSMYLFSDKNSDLRNASFAVMQSVGIAVAANAILKSITGRTPPNPDSKDKYELSRDFNFSFFGGDIHYGWPSGHLMTNTAMVLALTSYYKDIKWLKWAGYSYLAALAATVLIDERGSAHWFSEIVAGTIMGYVIGTTVGNNFRREAKPLLSRNSIELSPIIMKNYYGLNVGIKL